MKRSIQIYEARVRRLGCSRVPCLQIGGRLAEIAIRGVCVWRREPDGIWRIAHDISSRSEQLPRRSLTGS